MALKFWLGGARSDKSQKLREYILEEADRNPGTDYLIVVPEQFGLSTQREYVLASRNKGILNIDVLSFMRLAHRISDEVGSYDTTVTTLDDMGKNLILQLIASSERDQLTAFEKNIDRLGTVTRLKSMISEFMQYGIAPDKVDEMINTADKKGRGLLAGKLKDVNYLYRRFLEFIKDKYTTTEETLDRVSSIIYKSDTIKKSVIVFDGFTGFTPVQNKLIATLMEYAKDIHVALLLEDSTDVFDMSRTTIDKLERMASDRQVIVREPYEGAELRSEPEYKIFAALNPEEEMEMVAADIRRRVIRDGCRYKDIAVITGDLDSYRRIVTREFRKYEIPCFVDRTQPMLLNPFVEYIRSLIEIYSDNYSYEAMFRFLKSGMYPLEPADIDMLDNYCLAAGIKGSSSWHKPFYKTTDTFKADKVTELEKLRKDIIADLDLFSEEILGEKNVITASTKASVRSFTIALYKLIEKQDIEEKLKTKTADFKEKGDFEKAAEYDQVYVKVMRILEEIVDLIPDEMVDVRSFGDIVNAGLDSIRIGTPPLGSDYVQVGDLVRSRLNDIKVLYIVGANEGIIPGNSGSSGVIGESDRQFLMDNVDDLTIAPTARQDAFNQRLYLYMALNKPEEALVLSYSGMTLDGKTALPSYIIRKVKKDKKVRPVRQTENVREKLLTKETGFGLFATLIRKILSGEAVREEVQLAKELMNFYGKEPDYQKRMINVLNHSLMLEDLSDDNSIGRAVAQAIYGRRITGSVTRLESYANCAYQYFLRYGLSLKKREVFSFEASDLGNIFHNSLAEYSDLITKKGYTWLDVPDEESEKLMDEAVGSVIAKEGDAALYSTARTAYMVSRIKRIMKKTAEVVTAQAKAGVFRPKHFELDFTSMDNLDSLHFKLSEDEEMRLLGRIDRVDTLDEDDKVYVKIIDYKSSGKSMDLAAVYEGRQLQLLVYLNAALENEEKTSGRQAIPAGVLYYHIEDPLVDDDGDNDEEHIKAKIMDKLKLTGFINGDDNGKVIAYMDAGLDRGGKASSLKASRKKDGTLGKSADIVSGEDMALMGEYVNKKICQIGRDILDGNIGVPVADGKKRLTEPNCTWCDYKSICASNRAVNNPETQDEDTAKCTDEKEDYLQMMREVINGIHD